MPGTGRPTSPWWAHFKAVEGCIQIFRFLVMNLECAGDFRVAQPEEENSAKQREANRG